MGKGGWEEKDQITIKSTENSTLADGLEAFVLPGPTLVDWIQVLGLQEAFWKLEGETEESRFVLKKGKKKKMSFGICMTSALF
ncbi:hypothetical protein TNIN_76061 [Trichonephila inaurata madagascariensis]|uniref:Uncharacterized protein n=1 Tax=Trichonephila inaurata madagascariensis TaxID=2747483 RepID=A0A8X6ITE4_9ARAC|nr:hypothetical protein TNIN_76061 [Trichonephila inaurata madagascariensis]